ncbi:MAG: alpha/beta hydrolase [Sphingobacteriales bacterium]|nr:MAG: alpha/beta hydrolase [Sphingobacteriales bacterium]
MKGPVLLFVHGGNWNTGNKNTYGFYGRNFAKRDVIVVVPDYTLSPDANLDQMAAEVAQAIFWTHNNIASYGGNPEKLFVTGHSAGAQLGALAVMNPKYEVPPKMISGLILIDGAGMDLEVFLKKSPPTKRHDYLATFSNDPEVWKAGSPANFVSKETPPVLLYIGKKTYPVLKESSEAFVERLRKVQPDVKVIYQNKSHIPMMLQYVNPGNESFGQTIEFINSH